MSVLQDSEPFMSFNANQSIEDAMGEEDEITPAQLLAEMKFVWQNEVNSPVLLPGRHDVVENLVDQVEGMEENINSCSDKTQVKIAIHRMELQRISYIINDYTRVRLQKMEKNPRSVLKEHVQRVNEGKSALLDENEIKFVARYAKAEAKLLTKSFLAHLAPSLKKIPVAAETTSSNRVLGRVMEEGIEGVYVPDYRDQTAEFEVNLEQNTIHLLPLNSVRDHIESGKVSLL